MRMPFMAFALLVTLAMLQSPARAENDSLRIYLKGGGTTVYSLEDIKKITFDLTGVSNNNMSQLSGPIRTLMLLQNYPNPFSPRSTIEYQLPKPGPVELKVYNLNGQLVRTLVKSDQAAGFYEVKWDSKNDNGFKVANGAYLYQLKHDGKSLTKKMIIIK